MSKGYCCLKQQKFQDGEFSLVPVREEDKYSIMQWRNEQLYHLRQQNPLTKQNQDDYFKNVVAHLFEQLQPTQLLFSYLKNEVCIGYGGLVHLNWTDKNSEISFIIDTKLEQDFFEFHWTKYLGLIEKIAFNELNFHKLYTYAFDVRPQIYPILENSGFSEAARLKEHCFFNGKFIDVIIHSKINTGLTFRRAVKEDMPLYLDWANDELVRKQSYQTAVIKQEEHERWFLKKISDENAVLLVFENETKEPVGQVKFERQQHPGGFVIGSSVAKNFRGKGLAAKMWFAATDYFLDIFPSEKVFGYIRRDNIRSVKAVEKAGFNFYSEMEIDNVPSVVYTKARG